MRGQLAESNRRQETLKESYKMVASELDKDRLVEKEKEYASQIISNAKRWLVAFHLYAAANRDKHPTTFEQARPLVDTESEPDFYEKTVKQFELFPMASPQDANMTDLVLLRGSAMHLSSGQWLRIYGFADGHVEALDSANGDFTAAEAVRKVVYPPRPE